MIDIKDKDKCCGCEACVQICPRKCIELKADIEGFLYPAVNLKTCINCGLCEKTCPVINKGDIRLPMACYAAVNPDEGERLKSSSGGVFILLAKQIISEGGIVFGACFDDNWNVVHRYSKTMDGLYPFMGSKYVQSHINDSYVSVREFLNKGIKVLFSGTPCQNAGLLRFLHKKYDNLITVDFICHGVPSPKIWKQYLEEIKNNANQDIDWGSLYTKGSFAEKHKCKDMSVSLKRISFRDKSSGWKKYCLTYTLAKPTISRDIKSVRVSHAHNEDSYFLGFNNFNLYLRPSCMKCPAKSLRSGSDITLADFWGIDTLYPDLNDDKGISAVMVNTIKGNNMMQTINLDLKNVEYDDIVRRNSSIKLCSTPPRMSFYDIIFYKKFLKNKRNCFFADANRSVIERVKILAHPSLCQQIKKILRYIYYTYIRKI